MNVTAKFVSIDIIKSYHAHVYFGENTLELAQTLCNRAGELFPLQVGRFHHKPVVPHPCWSCQLAFEKDLAADVLSWLSLNRDRLNVLVHPLTGNDLKDHTDHAIWLGTPQTLNLAALR